VRNTGVTKNHRHQIMHEDIARQQASYFLPLSLQMKDGPSLRVVERGGTVQGAQEEGRKEQARGGLKSQTPSQLTVHVHVITLKKKRVLKKEKNHSSRPPYNIM
jgi:hypothetical protein